MDSVQACARRGGEQILHVLSELLQHRLLGCGPGERAHQLVDKFMTCVRPVNQQQPANESFYFYCNNPVDPGNKQRRREANRGDIKTQSTGFRNQMRIAAKAKQVSAGLAGLWGPPVFAFHVC